MAQFFSFHIWRYHLLLTLWLLFAFGKLAGQTLEPAQVETYKQQSRNLISFVQYSFNVLGDPASSQRDKETIISNSYTKAFRDDKVQIEDDLAEIRSTVTNKDVQAYLKDIDFFFKEVKFDFQVEEVLHQVKEDGSNYFIIRTNRNLKGLTVDGDSLYFNQLRFFEVNLDFEKQDLKIVSVYTTKLSQNELLANWWNQLDTGWRNWFGPKIRFSADQTFADLQHIQPGFRVGDTLRWQEFLHGTVSLDTSARGSLVTLDPGLSIGDSFSEVIDHELFVWSDLAFQDLKQLQALTEIDLRGFPDSLSLEPLSEMTQLRKVNLSGTQAADLTPLRNLTRLEELNISRTPISDLSPLRYASSLRVLSAEKSALRDLDAMAWFVNLTSLNLGGIPATKFSSLGSLASVQDLDLSGTQAQDISFVASMRALRRLNLSGSLVFDLGPLAELNQLEVLEANQCPVFELAPLRTLPALRLLFLDGTKVSTLSPLSGSQSLRKVYCDNSFVSPEVARRFMQINPNILVIYASASRASWWAGMSPDWKIVFRRYVVFSGEPGREALQEMANLHEIDITGRRDLADLSPLSQITGLEVLKASHTGISDLSPLSDLVDLHKVYIDYTSVSSLAPLSSLLGLRVISASGTAISSVEPLSSLENLDSLATDSTLIPSLAPLRGLAQLREVYCDGCPLSEAEVREFLLEKPTLLLVYKTAQLTTWWDALSPDWKAVFSAEIQASSVPSRTQLALIPALQSVDIHGYSGITDLSPLKMCFTLRRLFISGTSAADLSPLSFLSSLQVLDISRNPVSGLVPVGMLKGLVRLSLSQTPVSDLTPILDLQLLEELTLSGTQVDNLKPLSGLLALQRLDLSGTDVKNLKPIWDLPKLQRLLVFNTKVNPNSVAKFKAEHPSCEVVFY
jgi:Leucine-rich repeat (LRR) protein